MAHCRLWENAARYRALVMCRMLIICLLLLGGTGCSDQGQGAPGQAQGAGGPAGMGQGAGPDQAPIPVAVESARSGSIASFYNATSTLEAEKEARILARATGTVATLEAEEGDFVQEGEPLLTIGNEEYRYRLQQAEAASNNLRARFQRFEAMMAEQLTTEEEFQAARSDLATAEAEEGMARLNLSYTTVRAPFTGRVTARLVDLGQNLSVGTEVMVMADFDPLLARVHVPSREFNKLQQNQSVDLVLDSSGTHLVGRIMLISPVIDPNSGTIKITVEVPEYPAATRPGDFAEVRIVTEMREGVLLVPRTAVITDKGETVVFVALDGGDTGKVEADQRPSGPRAERRVVTTGFTDDDNTEIVTGLAPGELVVVKGQRSLKHGSPLKILEDDGGENGPRADSIH